MRHGLRELLTLTLRLFHIFSPLLLSSRQVPPLPVLLFLDILNGMSLSSLSLGISEFVFPHSMLDCLFELLELLLLLLTYSRDAHALHKVSILAPLLKQLHLLLQPLLFLFPLQPLLLFELFLEIRVVHVIRIRHFFVEFLLLPLPFHSLQHLLFRLFITLLMFSEFILLYTFVQFPPLSQLLFPLLQLRHQHVFLILLLDFLVQRLLHSVLVDLLVSGQQVFPFLPPLQLLILLFLQLQLPSFDCL